MVSYYKYILVEYKTHQKIDILNTFYFKEKKEVYEHLNLSSNQFENWINQKLKLRRKHLKHLQRYDIFRKYYANKTPTIEDYVKMPIKDFEELLKIVKHNLKKIEELKQSLSSSPLLL